MNADQKMRLPEAKTQESPLIHTDNTDQKAALSSQHSVKAQGKKKKERIGMLPLINTDGLDGKIFHHGFMRIAAEYEQMSRTAICSARPALYRIVCL
jgi:hypothetical protein